MIGLLSGVWGKLLLAGGVLLGVLASVLRLQSNAKRAGADEARRQQAEQANVVKERMDEAGDRARADDPVDRLRDGTF